MSAPDPGPGRRASPSTVDEPGMIATSFPGFADADARPGRRDRRGVTMAFVDRRRRSRRLGQGHDRHAAGRGSTAVRCSTTGPALSRRSGVAGRARRRPGRRGRARRPPLRRLDLRRSWSDPALPHPRGRRGWPAAWRCIRRSARPCAISSAAFARRPGGAVIDGRDIGTVIAPDAPAKLYRHRYARGAAPSAAGSSWRGQGEAVTYAEILADIRRRDERDGGRAAAPHDAARPTPSCWIPSEMTIEQAADAARRIVEAARARWEKSLGRLQSNRAFPSHGCGRIHRARGSAPRIGFNPQPDAGTPSSSTRRSPPSSHVTEDERSAWLTI